MDAPALQQISHQGQTLAIILRASYDAAGLKFLTPDSYPMQVAYMKHPAGHRVQAHKHNPVEHRILETQEVLFVRQGRMRVDFFTEAREPVGSAELAAGDLILLCGGGHGFTMLEETVMVEVKQGPYVGEAEKTKFDE